MTSGPSATIKVTALPALAALCFAGCASGGSSAVPQTGPPPCEPALVGVAPSNWSYEDALAALTEIGWLSSDFTVVQLPKQPEVSNRRETMRALVRSYAAHLRDRGIGGQVNMLLWVDAVGKPQRVQVVEKSQYPELDDAAHYVTRVMRFHPALYDGCRVPAAVLIPIVFRSPRVLPPTKHRQ